MEVRNILFDLGWLKSYKPKIKSIAVGNLSVGGTGKTPFTELLIRNFQRDYKIAVISRGYGRKTKGFLLVNESSKSTEVGDESLQIKQKFPGVKVAVCEKRSIAVKKIENNHPDIDLVIFDDAFQHRFVQAKAYVLLTTFANSYSKDFVLPMGRLREFRKGSKRADVIVVTKCPPEMSQFDMNSFKNSIEAEAYQQVYFSREKYGKPYDLHSRIVNDQNYEAALVISGIADNTTLLDHLSKSYESLESFNLPDHVKYDQSILNRIKKRYFEMNDQLITCILTTEKDAVKLKDFEREFEGIPILVLPYEHDLLDMDVFVERIEDVIKG